MTKIIKRPLLAATGLVLTIANIWISSWLMTQVKGTWMENATGVTGALIFFVFVGITVAGFCDKD